MRGTRRRLVLIGLVLSLAATPLPQTGQAAPPADNRVSELGWSPDARAMAAARRTGQRVELPSLRTETGQVFANPDGSKTMQQHAAPVRVRRGTGWVAPDTTLRRQPDGTVRPGATVTPIVLSGGGGSLLSFGKPGARMHLGWPGRLPAPQLRGNIATYAEVLPGVDLRITVGVDDYQQVLVVKHRTAALNPALRTLRYPVKTEGLTLRVQRDGTTVAVDRYGQARYRAPAPVMWDQPQVRTARLGLKLASGQFQLTPNLRMLTDPKARFPLYLDPSLSGNLINWLHVNVRMGGQNGWFYDRNDEGAKVGRAYNDTANLYRSMFLFHTTNGAATIAGSRILHAQFRITINKSPSGTPTPVQLWWLHDLNNGSYIDWGNQGGYWRQFLEQRDGEAYPHHEDNPIEFGHPTAPSAVSNVLQDVANGRRGTVSFGLIAQDENNHWQWKKFHPHTAVLEVRYNTKPRMPKGLNFTRPRPCGTATAPTAIATKSPQFSAVGNDPDAGDNITTRLEILNPAGTVVHSSNVGPTVTGAAFSWPEVPPGVLADGVVYRFRAVTSDGVESGPVTPECHFVVDTVKPAVPEIQSADFPDGEPVTLARTAGTVTFRPGSGTDTDVAEYAYGFQKDKMTMRVKAGANGAATIPVTVWEDPVTQVPSARLYVKAVDRAGNISVDRPAWDLQALDSTDPVTHVRGDSNGDGRADVTAVFDHGFGRTAVWNVTSSGAGFHTGVISWDAGEGGGFALSRTRPVQGDLNGDGKTDLAMFREGAGRQVWLYKLLSDGNRHNSPPALWTSGPNSWPLSTARTIAGDVDGDGKDDVLVQNPGTGENWQALVFRAANDFSQPTAWAQSLAGNPWPASTPLLADVDGDQKADLLSMRNLGGCRTVVDMYRSTGTSFAAATQIYDSGAGGHCWEKGKAVVADPDGDGKDDILVLYENLSTDASLFVFRSSGTTLTRANWGAVTELELAKATLAAGDFDGNGKEDVAILYAGGQVGDRQVYTLPSSGTGFGPRTLGWGGPVGAVTGPKFDIEHRQYELVNKHSGKCLNVSGASTADQAKYIQWKCLPVDLNARFQLEPVAGTEQYALRPAHTAVAGGPTKCADVGGWSMQDGGEVIQWPCGNGLGEPTANQQVTIEYVDGSSFDTVVQLRFGHSAKCLTVKDAGLGDGSPIEQRGCGQLANQQWILRPTYNATQLGGGGATRYRVEAATSPDMVLDIVNCQTQDGAPIRMWNWVAGSLCQRWKLESLGDDVYKIVDPNSGKAVEIEGCSKLPRASVYLWTSNDSECEKWRIEPSPGGSYRVVAVSSGLAMDVAGCSAAAGAEVITWFYHGGPCQRWFFEPA